MKTWAIGYDNSSYIVRGDNNNDYIFGDYRDVVSFAKTLEGEHKFYDLPTEGVIELFYGIVVKLDTHDGKCDNYLMGHWLVK